MIVKGHTITAALQEELVTRMQAGPFSSYQIQGMAERNGIPSANDASMRVADRIIQRERQAGNIALVKRGTWIWLKKPEA